MSNISNCLPTPRVCQPLFSCMGSKWGKTALVIAGFIGAGALTCGLLGFLAQQGVLSAGFAQAIGTIGQGGTITLMAGGGVLALGGVAVMISLAKAKCPRSFQTKYTQDIFAIGTSKTRISKTMVIRVLSNCKNNKIFPRNLIIFGDNLELNEDPGILALNPEKLILVGARIVHEPCASTRLDEKLTGREEWLSNSQRTIKTGEDQDTRTFVTQIIVPTFQDALDHKPPSRGTFKGNYHVVYQVRPEE